MPILPGAPVRTRRLQPPGVLAEFVDGGKGLFGLHGATTSFKESALYVEMLGSSFLRHPPRHRASMVAVPAQRNHTTQTYPPASGLETHHTTKRSGDAD